MKFNEKTARLNALRQLLTSTDYQAIRAFEDAISLEIQKKITSPIRNGLLVIFSTLFDSLSSGLYVGEDVLQHPLFYCNHNIHELFYIRFISLSAQGMSSTAS